MNAVSRKIGAFEKRIHEIDFIRGFLMLLVVMDHLFWALKAYGLKIYDATNIPFFHVMYTIFNFYWTSVSRVIIRQIVLFGFVFVSGISCAFSKSNWKRAGLMIVVWAGLLLITNIINGAIIAGGGSNANGLVLDFNVIGVLAWSILIYCFVEDKSWKTLAVVGLISLLISIIVIPALLSIDGMENIPIAPLWRFDFAKQWVDAHTVDGVVTYYYGDWLPLFPYICYFFMGAIAARFLYKDKKSLFPKRYEFERPFCFVGRHAIWVYFAHEPIILGLALASLALAGGH